MYITPRHRFICFLSQEFYDKMREKEDDHIHGLYNVVFYRKYGKLNAIL